MPTSHLAAHPHRVHPTSPLKFAPAPGPATARPGLRTVGGKEGGERPKDRGTGPGSRRGRERASQRASECRGLGEGSQWPGARRRRARGRRPSGPSGPPAPQPLRGRRAPHPVPSPPRRARGFLPRRRGRSCSRLRAPVVGGGGGRAGERPGRAGARARGSRGAGSPGTAARRPAAPPHLQLGQGRWPPRPGRAGMS